MKPVASAKPGNVNVYAEGKRSVFYRIRTQENIAPVKRKSIFVDKPKDFLLVVVVKSLKDIIHEGCLECFMESLKVEIEEEEDGSSLHQR